MENEEPDWLAWWLELGTADEQGRALDADLAHDQSHVERVVANTRQLAAAEGLGWEIVVPAAWFHDCVTVAKNSPARSQASRHSASRATRFLRSKGFAADRLEAIGHAIAAHSFSAGIACQSLEAQVVQDADRLDALGAIGLARCVAVGSQLGLPLYDVADPFWQRREADDSRFVLDHLQCKLLQLPSTMQTEAGRAAAHRRAQFLLDFLDQLAEELAVGRGPLVADAAGLNSNS